MEESDAEEDRSDAPAGLAVPPPLDADPSGRRFTAEGMRPLRVLFLVSEPSITPAISVHAMLARFLHKDRVRVHLAYERPPASPASPSNAFPEDAERRAMSFGPQSRSLRALVATLGPAVRDLVRTAAYARRREVDVVHCYNGGRNQLYGLLLAKLSGAKWIVGFHSQYGDWMSRLARFTLRRADAVLAVSEWTGRSVHGGGIPRERIFAVLNGLDTDRWRPDEADAGAVRKELGIAADAPVVVCVAQLVAWKRQDVLVKAFAAVVDARTDARLLLVGTERQAPAAASGPAYTEELRRLVAELGLERNVVFMGFRRDVRDILAAADISALPSVGDPSPLAHCEAMAMGKPVVAVADGGAPELIEHGVTGLLSPPDDVAALAANLRLIVEDDERRRELGVSARRRALEVLGAQRVADEVEAVYRVVVGMPAA